MSDTWSLLAGLALEVEDYALDGLAQEVTSGFERKTTLIRLRGGGEEGVGEDVTYDSGDQEALQAAGPNLPLAGSWTLRSFAEHLGTLELFPKPPTNDVFQRYRTWAYESAALDLALRQAGTSLHAVLGREPRPLTFVMSLRLGEPPSIEPVLSRLEPHPSLRFKLDATSSWDDPLIAELVQTGAVDSIDLKSFYVGSPVDQGADPELYRRVADAFPDAWLEDAGVTDETRPILEPIRDRLTWDAPIHGIADIEALPWPPRMVNVKPSRVGGVRELCAVYDFCAQRGIGMYGGGQFELGPGRGHIQLLASIFHPDTPNDVAPSGYNAPEPPPELPDSPLEPQAHATGFRWG